MKKATKAWLIAAAALIVTGCALFAGVMTTIGWNFTKLSTAKYETNVHEVDRPFSAIAVTTDTADVAFVLSDDGRCRVECREEENARHTVTVEGDTLTVKREDQRPWYDHVGISLGATKVTVYLPKTEYSALSVFENIGNVDVPQGLTFVDAEISVTTGDVRFFAAAQEKAKIKTSTGDIRVENISAGSLDLSVTTGKVTLSGAACTGDVTVGVSTGKAALTAVSCRDLTSTGATGSLSLDRVTATGRFSIKRSTGSVKMNGCDAAEISVKTGTGDVTGTLLTGKVFITATGTGRVDVPQTTTGGRCEIVTGTGDIRIQIG